MGIGDTIRVSLSADPVEEVKVGFEILKSLGLRTGGDHHLLPVLRAAGVRRDQDGRGAGGAAGPCHHPMSLSIIGCVVNGPGEALMTDIGFTGGGAGSRAWSIWRASRPQAGQRPMIDHIVELVEKKAAEIEAAEACR
jgi:(E)-4-hydroxy-3-methylbut-2-enyl-diphosphate synthase